MGLSTDSSTRLLFIGDSITDCNRRDDPERIGYGYVRLVRDYLRAKSPQRAPQVINTGISGNTIVDLAARWGEDALAHTPDILSILIGINDVWQRVERTGNGGVPIEQFRTVYQQLLQLVRERLPNCQIVLCQPTVILPPAHPRGQEELAQYVEAAGEIGRQFSVSAVVPLHSAFLLAHKFRPDIDWTVDGVHPTTSGHMIIARTWMETTGML